MPSSIPQFHTQKALQTRFSLHLLRFPNLLILPCANIPWIKSTGQRRALHKHGAGYRKAPGPTPAEAIENRRLDYGRVMAETSTPKSSMLS